MKEQIRKGSSLVASGMSLLEIGGHADLDPTSSITLKFINALTLAGIIVPFLSLFVVDFDKVSFIPHILFVLISSGVLYLNHSRKYRLAQLILILVIPTIQLVSVVLLEQYNTGAELTIIPFIIIVPFIYKDWKIRFLFISYLMFLIILGIDSRGYPISDGFIFNVIAVVLGISLGIYLLTEHLKNFTTELARKNKELGDQNLLLEKLLHQNAMKSELLGILSHDLKAPAQSFSKLSEKVAFLLRNNEHETLMDLADSFEESSNNLFRNIDFLLNWAISEKDIRLHIDKINVASLLNMLIDSLASEQQKRKTYVHSAIPKNQVVHSDKHLISIILKNLIDNAIKYSPKRSLVLVEASVQSDHIIISIHDYGPGVDVEKMKNIKAGKLEKSKDGYGIGLNTCFNLIDRLNGSIEFIKRDIIGTRVEVAIPDMRSEEIDKLSAAEYKILSS